MDNMGEWERKNLINELMQGRELTKQLQAQIHASSSSASSSSSSSVQELLVFRILLSYDKALSMLNWNYAMGEPMGSPPSLGESPMSGDSDRDNREHDSNDSRKRKAAPRWTKRVKVTHGTGLEGPLDDGHGWRKYGQKDILGAKYPRGYYRCTHRGAQGCLATKQVQRSDDDPAVFEITYRGRHTCNHASAGTNPQSLSPENQEPNTAMVDIIPHQQQQQQANLEPQKGVDTLLDFYKDLTLLPGSSSKNPFPAFNFPSISDNPHHLHPSFDIKSLPFNFPESSTGFGSFRGDQNFNSLDQSELGQVISAANKVASSAGTNSGTVDAGGSQEFAFGSTEFNNSFGNRGFFSN